MVGEWKKCVIACAVIILFLEKGNCLKCYSCVYDSNDPSSFDCGSWNLAKKHLIQCSSHHFFCSVIRRQVNGESETIRSCLPNVMTGSDACVTTYGETFCFCQTDGCNSGSSTRISIMILLICALISSFRII